MIRVEHDGLTELAQRIKALPDVAQRRIDARVRQAGSDHLRDMATMFPPQSRTGTTARATNYSVEGPMRVSVTNDWYVSRFVEFGWRDRGGTEHQGANVWVPRAQETRREMYDDLDGIIDDAAREVGFEVTAS